MKQGIPINPVILSWARETAGYSIDKIKGKYPKLEAWENGKSFPTYYQLEDLAKCYNRPIALFFFPEPPQEATIEKSLRAISEEDLHNLTPRVRYLFRKAKACQLYLKELFSEDYPSQLEKISWINNSSHKPFSKLTDDIRASLNISLEQQTNWKDADEALEEWRSILADKGVYVFKEAFKNDGVSGFCIYDEVFPIIFINNSLSKNRQIFTIFHELAHLILKQNDLDIFDDKFWNIEYEDSSHIEVKCNAFAANFLVPDHHFLSQLPTHFSSNSVINGLAAAYKVSNEVILRKLLTLNKITGHFYRKKREEWKKDFQEKKGNKQKSKGGGQYNYTQLAYLGRPYFSLVLEKYYQGKIGIERASEYLNINPKSFLGIEEAFLRKGMSDVRL